MAIVYTNHLKRRLKERRFPVNYPTEIYNKAEVRYYDTIRCSQIAIKKMKYGGKEKKILIAYVFDSNDVKILTIHPVSNQQIQKWVGSGRYTLI